MFCIEGLNRVDEESFFEISLPEVEKEKDTSLWQVAFKEYATYTYFQGKPEVIEEQISARRAFSLIIPREIPKKIRRYHFVIWNSLEERCVAILNSREHAFLFKTVTSVPGKPCLQLGLWKGSCPDKKESLSVLLETFKKTTRTQKVVEIFFISGRDSDCELMKDYLKECVDINTFFTDGLHGVIMGENTKAYVTFDAEGTPCAVLEEC